MAYTRPWPLPPRDAAATIHHITDSHIGYSDPYTNSPWDKAKADAVIRDVDSVFVRRVDGLVHAGDIVDDGGGTGPGEGAQDPFARSWLSRLAGGLPSAVCPGNHDLRDREANLGGHQPYSRAAWEYVYQRSANSVVDIGELRVITFAPDQHTWDAAEKKATPWTIPPHTLAWIDAQAQQSDRPVILANHYPLEEMNLEAGLSAPGASVEPRSGLDEVIEANPAIAGMLTGHRHLAVSYKRVATVLTVGKRSIIHLCGPSSAFSKYASTVPYADPSAPQYSLYVSILEPTRWQVRLRTHTPGAWADIDGWRVTELDSAAGTVTHTEGGS